MCFLSNLSKKGNLKKKKQVKFLLDFFYFFPVKKLWVNVSVKEIFTFQFFDKPVKYLIL